MECAIDISAETCEWQHELTDPPGIILFSMVIRDAGTTDVSTSLLKCIKAVCGFWICVDDATRPIVLEFEQGSGWKSVGRAAKRT